MSNLRSKAVAENISKSFKKETGSRGYVRESGILNGPTMKDVDESATLVKSARFDPRDLGKAGAPLESRGFPMCPKERVILRGRGQGAEFTGSKTDLFIAKSSPVHNEGASEGATRVWNTPSGPVQRTKQGGKWVASAKNAMRAGSQAGKQAAQILTDPSGAQAVGAIAQAPAQAIGSLSRFTSKMNAEAEQKQADAAQEAASNEEVNKGMFFGGRDRSSDFGGSPFHAKAMELEARHLRVHAELRSIGGCIPFFGEKETSEDKKKRLKLLKEENACSREWLELQAELLDYRAKELRSMDSMQKSFGVIEKGGLAKKGKLLVNGEETPGDLIIEHEGEVEKARKDPEFHSAYSSLHQRDRHYWGEDGDTEIQSGHPFERVSKSFGVFEERGALEKGASHKYYKRELVGMDGKKKSIDTGTNIRQRG